MAVGIAFRTRIRERIGREIEDCSQDLEKLAEIYNEAFSSESGHSKTQLNNLERVASGAGRFGDVVEWVKRQTGKEKPKKEKRRRWARKTDRGLFGVELVKLLEKLKDVASKIAGEEDAPEDSLDTIRRDLAAKAMRDLNSRAMYLSIGKGK